MDIYDNKINDNIDINDTLNKYKIIYNKKLSWNDAELYCNNQYGTNLLSITSNKEFNELLYLIFYLESQNEPYVQNR